MTANSNTDLEILHNEFTPEELMFVNVHVRTPKALMPLANVGRAFVAFQKNEKLARREVGCAENYTALGKRQR